MQYHDGVAYSCAFNQDCATACTASSDGNVQILDTRALAPNRKAPVLTIPDAAATGTVFKTLWRGEFEVLSCGEDYCAKRWDIRNLSLGPLTNFFGHTSTIRSMALSSDEHYLVTAAVDGCVRVWVVDEVALVAEEQDRHDLTIEQSEVRREQLERTLNKHGFGQGGLSP